MQLNENKLCINYKQMTMKNKYKEYKKATERVQVALLLSYGNQFSNQCD